MARRQKAEDLMEIAERCLGDLREAMAGDTARIIAQYLADAYNGGYDCGWEECDVEYEKDRSL